MEQFSKREAATILAALRYWQDGITDNFPRGRATVAAIPELVRTHFTGVNVLPLNSSQIDELCAKVNLVVIDPPTRRRQKRKALRLKSHR